MRFTKALSSVLLVGVLLTNTVAYGSSDVIFKSELVSEKVEVKKSNLTQIEAEEIISRYVKDFYGIEIKENQPGMNTFIQLSEDWNQGGDVWNLNLSQNKNDYYFHINAAICDKTGKLLRIQKHEGSHREPDKISQYTYEEATDVATKFLEKFNPQLFKQVSIKQNQGMNYHYYNPYQSYGLYPREYIVFFERVEDGVSFMNEGIHIGVNSATGEIVSYQYQWTEKELPKRNRVIMESKANEIFRDTLEFNLGYIPVSKGYEFWGKVNEVKLVYLPSYGHGHLIDASNGERLNLYTLINENHKKIDLTAEEKKQLEEKYKKAVKPTTEMTKEEAIKKAEDVLSKFYDDVKIGSVNYSAYGINMGHKTWNIQFMIGNSRMNNGHFSIDATTGEVLSINYHNWYQRELMMMEGQEFVPVIKWEEAYKKSLNLIVELYPQKLKSIKTEQTFIENTHIINGQKIPNIDYSFSFPRQEHGISASFNNIHVSFDSSTGLLQSLYTRWDDITLPKPERLIEKEEALENYMKQTKTELAYGAIRQSNTVDEKLDTVIKLVYRNIPQNEFIYPYIDAKLGKLLDHRGIEVKEEKQKASSMAELLKGHWAERELIIMHDNGIIDLQNFNLGDVITKKEVIRMMVNATGRFRHYEDDSELKFIDVSKEDPYYEDLKLAVRQGLIDNQEVELKGEAAITREEFAVMLVRMAKLDKIAKLQGVFTLSVGDSEEIDPEKIGYVALAYGFDVLKGNDGNFNPKEEVTLVQAALGIFRGFKFLMNIVR